MLPHVANRPLSLVRCRTAAPRNASSRSTRRGCPDVQEIPIREKSGTDDYLYIEDERGLVAAAQMGVLELHVWGPCRQRRAARPHGVRFDPDEGLGFATSRGRDRNARPAEGAQLESFPMVTGGKGVHVVVPLKPSSLGQHRDFSEALARVMAEEARTAMSPTCRRRSAREKSSSIICATQRGATAIAPFSSRSREGADVAAGVVAATWQR